MPNLLNPNTETTPRTGDIVQISQYDTGSPVSSTIANLATTVLAQPAVTADPGDNDTSVATTAFVTAAITAALAGGTPGSTMIDLVTETAQTTISDTPANITSMSHTLTSALKYVGRLVAFISTDQAAEGCRFDFAGTATWTEFHANIVGALGLTVSVGASAAIGTDLIATSLGDTTQRCVVIEFAGLVNAGGTFIPRIAQSAHSAGTLSLLPGSHFDVTNVP